MHSYNKNFLRILVIFGIVVAHQLPAFCSASAVELLTPNASPLGTMLLMVQSKVNAVWQWFGYKKIAVLLAVAVIWGYRRWQQKEVFESLTSPRNKQGDIQARLKKELSDQFYDGVVENVIASLRELCQSSSNWWEWSFIFNDFFSSFDIDVEEYNKSFIRISSEPYGIPIDDHGAQRALSITDIVFIMRENAARVTKENIASTIQKFKLFLELCQESETLSPSVKEVFRAIKQRFENDLTSKIHPIMQAIKAHP